MNRILLKKTQKMGRKNTHTLLLVTIKISASENRLLQKSRDMMWYFTENNPYSVLSLDFFFHLSTMSHKYHIGLIKSVMVWYIEIFLYLNKRFKC